MCVDIVVFFLKKKPPFRYFGLFDSFGSSPVFFFFLRARDCVFAWGGVVGPAPQQSNQATNKPRWM